MRRVGLTVVTIFVARRTGSRGRRRELRARRRTVVGHFQKLLRSGGNANRDGEK
jgi:hypothetical protein